MLQLRLNSFVYGSPSITIMLSLSLRKDKKETYQQTRAKPGAALQTPSSLINSSRDPLLKISLRCRHAQAVKNGDSSHEISYINILSEILNLEGHLNRCVGSQVTAILLNGSILPTGGVASVRVFPCCLRSRLVYKISPFQMGLYSIVSC